MIVYSSEDAYTKLMDAHGANDQFGIAGLRLSKAFLRFRIIQARLSSTTGVCSTQQSKFACWTEITLADASGSYLIGYMSAENTCLRQ